MFKGLIRQLVLATLALAWLGSLPARGERIAGTASDNLFTFDSATPGSVTVIPITGLLGGDNVIVGLDYRPTDGKVYAFSQTNIYTLDVSTGRASFVTGVNLPFGVSPTGYDFNPVTGLLHVSQFGGPNNLVVDPATGLVTQNPNFAGVLSASLAFSNNVAGATTTALYGIDRSVSPESLLRMDPSTGAVTTVGLLGTDAPVFSLDISGATGIAYAISLDSADVMHLGTVNLDTGGLTVGDPIPSVSGGLIADDFTVIPSAAVPEPSTLTLLGIGAICAFGYARRRRSRTRHERPFRREESFTPRCPQSQARILTLSPPTSPSAARWRGGGDRLSRRRR